MTNDPRADFKREVQVACAKKGITLLEMAALVGVSNTAIHAFFSGRSDSVRLALSMCQALNLDVRLAYSACGLPIPEPATTPEGHANAA